MFYFSKTPWWLQKLYGYCIWKMPDHGKIIYLTFDDGPHPAATPFVLDLLKKYNAKATFFCIGKNVVEQPLVYKRIIDEGHGVGNHTHNHLNGWKTSNEAYINNIGEAKIHIHSTLFRPPYGKITRAKMKLLSAGEVKFSIIMWTVLSGDFDAKLSKESCLQHVLSKSGKASIVVFHDSEKAYDKLLFALPKVLEYFAEKGFRFEKIVV